MSDFLEYKVSILENNKRNYDLILATNKELSDHIKDYMYFKGKVIGMALIGGIVGSALTTLAISLFTSSK